MRSLLLQPEKLTALLLDATVLKLPSTTVKGCDRELHIMYGRALIENGIAFAKITQESNHDPLDLF